MQTAKLIDLNYHGPERIEIPPTLAGIINPGDTERRGRVMLAAMMGRWCVLVEHTPTCHEQRVRWWAVRPDGMWLEVSEVEIEREIERVKNLPEINPSLIDAE